MMSLLALPLWALPPPPPPAPQGWQDLHTCRLLSELR